MSRVYAREEDSGRRFLVRLECDCCDASVKPHPDIAQSGWTKRGSRDDYGNTYEQDLCPEHS